MAQDQVMNMINDPQSVQMKVPQSSSHILRLISTLRKICNLRLIHGQHEVSQLSPSLWSHSTAQELFSNMTSTGRAFCTRCSSDLNIEDPSNVEVGSDIYRPRLYKCLRLLCGGCVNEAQILGSGISACEHGDSVNCTSFELSSRRLSASPSVNAELFPEITSLEALPPKVKALIASLQGLPENQKRFNTCLIWETNADDHSVVFSFWTSTLDIIKLGLRFAGFATRSYVRVDGKTPPKNRSHFIDQFQADPSIWVILISLSCGATGYALTFLPRFMNSTADYLVLSLTLTAASRVYIMEPQWNPMLEEQALDRVHRIGQTRMTTTVRYIIKDSIEEARFVLLIGLSLATNLEKNIMKLQLKKRDLASLILSQTRLCEGDAQATQLEASTVFLCH
ncbi:MAG: hypothetical protein M1834_007908 [Cirrosporium novae-zelandiae]|nr:MAG: hypothetical protein M1834_007908 [Cirrosporium novae-zelandiae]